MGAFTISAILSVSSLIRYWDLPASLLNSLWRHGRAFVGMGVATCVALLLLCWRYHPHALSHPWAGGWVSIIVAWGMAGLISTPHNRYALVCWLIPSEKARCGGHGFKSCQLQTV